MTDIQKITQELIKFRDERNWKQFHDTKNLATALSIEAAELNELFLWKDSEQSENVEAQRIKEELADVFAYAFLIAEKHEFDIPQIIFDKIKQNSIKYPVEKSRNKSTKYNQL
ncbi:nucleotide pyrophosphohydrolase [bacterium]|nr:nucleotide pyrophosphohydrolase [bacterium]